MSFKKDNDEFKALIHFCPDKSDWLDHVSIDYANPNEPRVQIFLLDRMCLEPNQIALFDQKLATLLEVRKLFDPDHISIPEDPRERSTTHKALQFIEDRSSGETFSASPTSHIRTVLEQMNIPKDIQVAVMDELQKIWARQK